MTALPSTMTAASASPRCWDAADLNGMVALVSGGGRGLGRVLATTLAERGAAAGLIARSAGELASTAEEITDAGGLAAAAVADVTDEAATAAAVASLRRRAPCAGGGQPRPHSIVSLTDRGTSNFPREDQPRTRSSLSLRRPLRVRHGTLV